MNSSPQTIDLPGRASELGKHERASGKYLLSTAKDLQDTLTALGAEERNKMATLDKERAEVQKDLARMCVEGRDRGVREHSLVTRTPSTMILSHGEESLDTRHLDVPGLHICRSSMPRLERISSNGFSCPSAAPNPVMNGGRSLRIQSPTPVYTSNIHNRIPSPIFWTHPVAYEHTGSYHRTFSKGRSLKSPTPSKLQLLQQTRSMVLPPIRRNDILEPMEAHDMRTSSLLNKIINSRLPRSYNKLRSCSSQEMEDLRDGRQRTSVTYMYGELRLEAGYRYREGKEWWWPLGKQVIAIRATWSIE